MSVAAGPRTVVATGRRGPPLDRSGEPVLMVGPSCREPAPPGGPPHVVVLLDGSRESEAVLTATATLAGRAEATVSLVHVGSPSSPSDLLAAGYLSRMARTLRCPARVDWEVLHGDAAAAVIDFARRSSATVIVVNSGGSAVERRPRCAATVAALVRRSPVPVLVTTGRSPETSPCHRGPRTRRPRTRPVPSGAGATSRQAALPDLPPPVPRRGWAGVLALVTAAVVSVGLIVPTPYTEVTAAALPAAAYVSSDPGHAHGEVLLLVVQTEPLKLLGAIRVWLDDGSRLERTPDANPLVAVPDLRQAMHDSAFTAITLAAEHLGLDPAAIHTRVATGELVGPSAGLAFAIAMTDSLSPGDLTGGRVIAATGELTPTGEVRPVGRVAEKAEAAAEAGADVLLVPDANAAEATQAADGLRVVGVTTFAEALEVLRSTMSATAMSAESR